MLIKLKIDEKKEQKIDKLKDEFLELQEKISDLRKRGKSTQIAEIYLLDLPTKIKTASNSYEQKDIDGIKRIIQQIRNEITEIENGSEFDHLNELLQNAYEDIRKGNKKNALEKYSQIMSLYKLLTKDLKKTVFSACAELHKRLS